MIKLQRSTFLALPILLVAAHVAFGAPIQAGHATYEYFNTFDAELLPGPFNSGTDPIPVTFESSGVLRSRWENQVGNSIAYEHTGFVSNGELPTVPPTPFQIIGGLEETPELGTFAGQLTNVVQDTGHPGFGTGDPASLTSALSFAEGQFGQFIAGNFLYADAPYSFEATISGLPYPVGTEFVNNSTSPFEVRLQLGPAPDASDPIVARALPGGIVRITRIVPEPTSGVACALALSFLARPVRGH